MSNNKTQITMVDIKVLTDALNKLQEGIDKGVQTGSYNLTETSSYIKSLDDMSKAITYLDQMQRHLLLKTASEQVNKTN
jgi:hypothetical protein